MSSKSSKKNNAPSTTKLIEIGRVVNTHGVRGEVRLLPHSAPTLTLRPGLCVTLRAKDSSEDEIKILQVRPRAPFLLLKFAGIESRNQAESLRDSILLVKERDLPRLEEGEFYHYQLIGLAIRTITHEQVGTIAEVLTTQGHDLLVVHNQEKEYLIPVVEDIIRTIDFESRQVIIDPPEGLLENE